MTIAQKNIIDTYSKLFEGLDAITKLELIERLSKSLKKEASVKENAFYKAFGAFPSDDRTDEEMVFDLKSSRKFIAKDLSF